MLTRLVLSFLLCNRSHQKNVICLVTGGNDAQPTKTVGGYPLAEDMCLVPASRIVLYRRSMYSTW